MTTTFGQDAFGHEFIEQFNDPNYPGMTFEQAGAAYSSQWDSEFNQTVSGETLPPPRVPMTRNWMEAMKNFDDQFGGSND